MLRQPELAEDPRFAGNAQRVAARDEVRRLIVEAFAPLTADEVVRRLDDAQIANAQVNDMHAVWAHPQLRRAAAGAKSDRRPARSRRCCRPARGRTGAAHGSRPALGEHTDAILAALGYAADAIAALRAENAI